MAKITMISGRMIWVQSVWAAGILSRKPETPPISGRASVRTSMTNGDELHEVAGDHRRRPAENGHEGDHEAQADNHDPQVETEDRLHEDADGVHADATEDDVNRYGDPGVKLLVEPPKPVVDRLDRGDHAQLPVAVGGEEDAEHQPRGVGGEQQQDERAHLVGLPRGAGKRPGTEGHHEARGADHPPEHAAAAAEVVAGSGIELAIDRAERQHEQQVDADDDVVDGADHAGVSQV